MFDLMLVFLVLKLTKVIDWNWIWIFSPIWIPFVFGIIAAIIVFSHMPEGK